MKRASFLAENTVSIVIAVLIISLFTYGIYYWYQSVTTANEIKAAQSTVDLLKAKIDALTADQTNNFTFQGFISDGWYITAWDRNKVPRPDKCSLKNCICVSPEPDPSSCQNNGFTRIIDLENVVVEYFFIQQNIAAPGGNIGGPKRSLKYIQIPQNLYLIEIIKTENSVKINSYSNDYFKP